MKQIMRLLLIVVSTSVFSQSRFPKHEFSLNAFRNPSIGVEYRYQHLSVHAGYYITALKAGTTTKFIKTGVTAWFLPLGKKEIPSSFYAGVSYLQGLNREYNKENAVGLEAGFRWMVWKGLNLRLGVIGLAAKGHDLKINPTPGISYSFTIK